MFRVQGYFVVVFCGNTAYVSQQHAGCFGAQVSELTLVNSCRWTICTNLFSTLESWDSTITELYRICENEEQSRMPIKHWSNVTKLQLIYRPNKETSGYSSLALVQPLHPEISR
jgi:hypothetical protein